MEHTQADVSVPQFCPHLGRSLSSQTIQSAQWPVLQVGQPRPDSGDLPDLSWVIGPPIASTHKECVIWGHTGRSDLCHQHLSQTGNGAWTQPLEEDLEEPWCLCIEFGSVNFFSLIKVDKELNSRSISRTRRQNNGAVRDMTFNVNKSSAELGFHRLLSQQPWGCWTSSVSFGLLVVQDGKIKDLTF